MARDDSKIQIDLSDRTKRSLRDAQARKGKNFYEHLQEAAATLVILAFSALVITAMAFAILWLLDQMPPLPF